MQRYKGSNIFSSVDEIWTRKILSSLRLVQQIWRQVTGKDQCYRFKGMEQDVCDRCGDVAKEELQGNGCIDIGQDFIAIDFGLLIKIIFQFDKCGDICKNTFSEIYVQILI